MDATRWPDPQGKTDEAVEQLLEYLALSGAVEDELEGIRPAIRRVVLELLVANEAAGHLTPFRAAVLDYLREAHAPAAADS